MGIREIESRFIQALHVHRAGRNKLHQNKEKTHELYQTSTMGALLEGVYDGNMSFGELEKHGDFGLGTFNGLDGEMLLLDGVFYQLRSDGKAYTVSPEMKTPFAAVLFFRPEAKRKLSGRLRRAELETLLEELVPSHNLFYAIKLQGQFSQMKVRSVPRQNKPYPPITDVVKTQPVFDLENVPGTMAGFRCPDYSQGLNIAGYHLHFIDDGRNTGGHVLDYVIEKGTLWIDHTSSFHVELPETPDFLKSELDRPDKDRAIKVTEG